MRGFNVFSCDKFMLKIVEDVVDIIVVHVGHLNEKR